MSKRQLNPGEVTIRVRTEWEQDHPEGHFASGDDKADTEMVAHILERIESGDIWGWCTVFVELEWAGFKGVDTLGACSYDSFDDFKDDGYYPDMISQALDNLVDNIEAEGWGVEVRSEALAVLQVRARHIEIE